jgi:uncharacterized protein DUF4962/heparinase II/III-like protein
MHRMDAPALLQRTLAASLLAAALGATAAEPQAACPPKSDILVRSDTTLAPVRPADCATVTQTPPELTWPPQNGQNTYTVALTLPDGKVETRTTPHNWMLWDHALPPGRYSWRVKPSSGNETSQPRTFIVAAASQPFVVPAPDVLLQRARQAPRPRTWAAGEGPAMLKSSRSGAFKSMVEEVQNKMPSAVQPEPASGSIESNYEDTVQEQKRTLAAALAWAATHDRRYGDDAFRRVMAQARWNTQGTLAYKANDMGSRTVAWTLALAYDWLHDYLKPEQKAVVAAAIRERVRPMYQDAVTNLAVYPYDSHGNITLTMVAAIGVLMAGELPEADAWVKDALPEAIVWTSPWGGNDGGFGNGTAQAFWDTGSNLPAWLVIRSATGVDLAKKDWVRNNGRFLAYFVPPGSPSGVFGDGLELNLQEVWARVAKAYERFAPSPLARWYAHAQKGEDETRIELMMSPQRDDGPANFPDGTPNAAVFPSVGWVAMHSDLRDPMRTSVYFKSSSYGSYNHSHADQNSFVIHDKGRRLAIASGYYDGYKTPHWTEWYKQTHAANAITFDGGHGQGLNDRRFEGAITRFESSPRFAWATGHAEKAYDGALTQAQRTIVYVHPDIVIVRDVLAAREPHAWEWNIHAMEKMERIDERTVQLHNGPARLCLTMLAGPDATFRQGNRFAPPPEGNPPPKDQWHGVFAANARTNQAEFVALMRIGAECGHEKAAATKVPGGWRIDAGAARITLNGDAAQVE